MHIPTVINTLPTSRQTIVIIRVLATDMASIRLTSNTTLPIVPRDMVTRLMIDRTIPMR